MSSSLYASFGLLMAILLFISTSISAVPYQKRSNQDYDNHNSNEDGDLHMMVYPKFLHLPRLEQQFTYHPRPIRNSWFRASTYQHMKPHEGSEEKPVGDNLMRWG